MKSLLLLLFFNFGYFMLLRAREQKSHRFPNYYWLKPVCVCVGGRERISMFPLQEFLVDTGGRNFTGTVLLTCSVKFCVCGDISVWINTVYVTGSMSRPTLGLANQCWAKLQPCPVFSCSGNTPNDILYTFLLPTFIQSFHSDICSQFHSWTLEWEAETFTHKTHRRL